MRLSKSLKNDILNHALQCYPKECCGVIVGKNYIPCENIATDNEQFEINPVELAKIEEQGEIIAYVHSHPDASAKASELDLKQIELHGKTWVICGFYQNGLSDDVEFIVYKPTGYQVPLLGRDFYHGWQDCYALIRDFYQRELNIELLDFERQDLWWENKDNPSLYLENFAKTGFYEVDFDTIQYGDVILCRVGRTEHVNHALIWLGDKWALQSEQVEPCVGNTLILHHPYERKSVREIFGQNWLKRMVKVVRHL